jgi:hypothetical protein
MFSQMSNNKIIPIKMAMARPRFLKKILLRRKFFRLIGYY